jgi:hypothetical protein
MTMSMSRTAQSRTGQPTGAPQTQPLQRWESEGGSVSHDQPNRSSHRDRIESRAYDIYLSRQRTGKPGSAASDWAQAEREVIDRA